MHTQADNVDRYA